VNMVIDQPFATNLGFNPIDLDIINKPWRKNNDVFINTWVYHQKEWETNVSKCTMTRSQPLL
jgi:hypothetical protein